MRTPLRPHGRLPVYLRSPDTDEQYLCAIQGQQTKLHIFLPAHEMSGHQFSAAGNE